ncbi:unnamed protein product [Owenia fusiformis]|uniref:Uncharacterized protein n=1 Tax=Owenia fusiformis TaxID=6347 RepID=A0A8J1TIW5_OWEFU|nr:unnamed protein product [Owenia fusiformis]
MLGSGELGVTTFFSSSIPNDKCGANGLPLTPNSIKVLGQFQQLITLRHPNLCRYVDMIKCKHERVIVVFEHHRKNLAQLEPHVKTDSKLLQVFADVLGGLFYLHGEGLVHSYLGPSTILLTEEGVCKLTHHGVYAMTGCGAHVTFPVGQVKYSAPEIFCKLPGCESRNGSKVDTWSLGITMLEASLGITLWASLSVKQIIQRILSFLTIDVPVIDLIIRDHKCPEKLEKMSSSLQHLITRCLNVNPKQRPTAEELLEEACLQPYRKVHEIRGLNGCCMFSTGLRCQNLELSDFSQVEDEELEPLRELDIDQVYYLWQLAGGDIIRTLDNAGKIKSRPPITNLYSFVCDDGESFGAERDSSVLFDDHILVLSLDQLKQRLSNLDETAYYPLLEEENDESNGVGGNGSSNIELNETATLPLVIKEKDIEYQFHRILLYKRLLDGYPYKRAQIWKEARVDIPPLVRPMVWAALLEIEGDVYGRYIAIDKDSPTPTDRQIEVDIPRCHQYDDLLSSPMGHHKLKRVLKAWVMSHPELVYWQGLDSLAAPFLKLNFNQEALAFACLDAFIPKYLNMFFLKDNSLVIQEYLAVFRNLIAFHDPALSNHLEEIGFIPDLYAIPWFLTMFAHVFPLQKIFHLWDTMLLGNSSLPLCIGVAILHQLRDTLLSFGFNECILLFSDMPEIDIEKCVQDSIRIFCSTPRSATFRQYAKQSKSETSNKPWTSYYSTDPNTIKSALDSEPIPLEELKANRCSRISAADLIELGELAGPVGTKSPTKKTKNSRPKILIIDIRSPEEYQRGTVPGSVNIPHTTSFSVEGTLNPTPQVNTLNAHRLQVKVIIGSQGNTSLNFGNKLVALGYSKVCVLHRGIEALRPTGLLVVPPIEAHT